MGTILVMDHYVMFAFIKWMVDAKSKQTDLPVEFLDLQNFKLKLVQNGKDLLKLDQMLINSCNAPLLYLSFYQKDC